MNTLILVNIAIIFIFSVTDISKTTTQMRLSTGNNISVFDHQSRRMLQNRRLKNLKDLLDLRKRAQKPSNKKRDTTNRPKRVGRPKEKPFNKTRENINKPKRIGRPKPKRIIRGELADIKKFPYMASLVTLPPVTVISSAIIVSEKWVVTHIIPSNLNEHFSDHVRILYQKAKNAKQWIHKINDMVDIFALHTGRLVAIEVDRPFKIRYYKIAHFAMDFNYAINSYVKVVGWELGDKIGAHQFDVDSLRYADTKLVQCDFTIVHQNIKHMFICTLGGIACWGDESNALVRNGLIAGILVQKEKTCGYLANKTTDMYLKSKYLIEYISKYIHTDLKYD